MEEGIVRSFLCTGVVENLYRPKLLCTDSLYRHETFSSFRHLKDPTGRSTCKTQPGVPIS